MKNYQEDYQKLYNTFLEDNQKKFKAYCNANDDCRESHLETQYLNDACERLVHLRKKTEDGLTYLDKFKENLIDEFENASLYKYKNEAYVNSFIERDLKKIRKEHIAKYNNVDDDFRRNHYCFYDFMINSSRNDVLKFLAEHNVLRNLLDDPKKNLWGINEEQQKDEYSSVIHHPVSQLVDSLRPHIQPEDVAKLTELFEKGEIEGRITIRIPIKKYFIRFFGRLNHLNLIQKSKKELVNWIIENFDIFKKDLSSPQKLKYSTEYKYLTTDISSKSKLDIKIVCIDD